MVRNGNGKSHQGERSEASSARGERERVEKKTRACPAAVDDDPFSALALRFRFYPGNLSLSLQLFTHTRATSLSYNEHDRVLAVPLFAITAANYQPPSRGKLQGYRVG